MSQASSSTEAARGKVITDGDATRWVESFHDGKSEHQLDDEDYKNMKKQKLKHASIELFFQFSETDWRAKLNKWDITAEGSQDTIMRSFQKTFASGDGKASMGTTSSASASSTAVASTSSAASAGPSAASSSSTSSSSSGAAAVNSTQDSKEGKEKKGDPVVDLLTQQLQQSLKIGEEGDTFRLLANTDNARLPTTTAEIKQFLSSPLNTTLPLHQLITSPSWFQVDPLRWMKMPAIANIVYRVIRDPVTQKGGQDGIHSLVNDLVVEPLTALNTHTNIHLTFGRNTEDNITTGPSLRPDVLVWTKRLLALRGEEENENYEKARTDLKDKLIWNEVALGSVPFVLSFAATREQIGFFAHYRCVDNTSNATTTSMDLVAGPFTLSLQVNRLQVLSVVVNIFRILKLMEPLIPQDIPQLEQEFEHGPSRITIHSTHVAKLCPLPENYESLRKLYDRLKSNHTTQVLEHKEKKSGSLVYLHLHVKPVGATVVIRTEDELKVAIRDVLLGLVDIHDVNFVHLDIRWQNILKGAGGYFIIDLERATTSGGLIPLPLPVLHAPELDAEFAPRAQFVHDMWLVGKLMDVVRPLSECAQQFQKLLMKPRNRLLPRAALAHPWLACLSSSSSSAASSSAALTSSQSSSSSSSTTASAAAATEHVDV